MALVEDDSILHPVIDDDCQLYISGLNEGHEQYTRFFDALLITRSNHAAFYRDLRAFRSQGQVIHTLQNANDDRNLYKDTTIIFLGSRFAHPWCRKTPMRHAWRAAWGSMEGDRRDDEVVREENRLHKLLVPVWVIMRSRMFPAKDIVRDWCVEERIRLKSREEITLSLAALELQNAKVEEENILQIAESSERAAPNSGLDDDQRRAAAHAATSVLRLAAAGMIISQMPKRKLRWLTKKPS